MKLLTFVFFAATLLSPVHGAIEIKSLDFKEGKDYGKLTLSYQGTVKNYPEFDVRGTFVEIAIPDARTKSHQQKSVMLDQGKKKLGLSLQNSNGNSVSMKAHLPFSLEKHKDKVSLMIKENRIELIFPKVLVAENKTHPTPSTGAKTVQLKKQTEKKAKTRRYLDEEYLDSLLAIEEEAKEEVKRDKAVIVKAKGIRQDEVTSALASSKKTTESSKPAFSLLEYGGKFVAFLGVVLLLFYGVITLMKKGVMKKGRLGFLNKTNQVEVLSQTYVAPKKSLMMIRAHNQVFLVSNTDSGIHPISEIRDVAGLLKTGERKIAGNNFDDSLQLAGEDELSAGNIKLKEDITQSNKASSLSDYAKIKDKVKFSDQIKKKVKGLKPLH